MSLEYEFKAGLQSMDKELGGVTGLGYALLSLPMALNFSVPFSEQLFWPRKSSQNPSTLPASSTCQSGNNSLWELRLEGRFLRVPLEGLFIYLILFIERLPSTVKEFWIFQEPRSSSSDSTASSCVTLGKSLVLICFLICKTRATPDLFHP